MSEEKVKVLFLGLQKGFGDPDYYLVNLPAPSCSTVKFNPYKHVIVGSVCLGISIPEELLEFAEVGL